MEPEKKMSGAMVGIIIIILILFIGGIYICMSNKNKVEPTTTPSETVTTQDSAELNKLDADLQTTNTSTGLDANAINAIN